MAFSNVVTKALLHHVSQDTFDDSKPTLVINPSIPFSLQIPGKLKSGRNIFIHGKVLSKCREFAINFGTSEGNIAFHFNPRFDTSKLVRNSLINREWGIEERELSQSFPFKKNKDFELIIKPDKDHFKVILNGTNLIDYYYRLSLDDINNVEIAGDVECFKLGITSIV